ncbi:MAG: glycosyltransferase family 2 protein [Candidatus Omnitrophota bacterium]
MSIPPNDAPRVTVVVANYNYAQHLPECLDSILRQTLQDFEILIADDGSSDTSLEILHDYERRYPGKLHMLCHPGRNHRGILATYRMAFSNLRGTFTAFLEADDRWEEDCLARKIAALEKFPSAGVAYSDFRTRGAWRHRFYWDLYGTLNKLQIRWNRPVDMTRKFLFRNPVSSFSNVVVRTALLQGLEVTPSLRSNLDWWLLAHLSLKTRFVYLPEKLWQWRIHPQSLGYHRVSSFSLWRLHRDLMALCESLLAHLPHQATEDKALERKRQAIERGLRFHRHLRGRDFEAVARSLLRHPLRTLRFLSYVVLKNLLF